MTKFDAFFVKILFLNCLQMYKTNYLLHIIIQNNIQNNIKNLHN